MNTANQQIEPGEFILQEAAGSLSRDSVLVASGNKLPAGAVVMLADGKFVPIDTAFINPPAVLYAGVDASAGDKKALAITRQATLDAKRLTFPASFSDQDKTNALFYMRQNGLEGR